MWDELGIAPSDDPKTIRRAYAARLKELDPDRDPAAFARLREAYERALDPSRPPRRHAEREAAEEIRLPADRAAAGRTASTEQVAEAYQPLAADDQDDIRDRALLIALDAALRNGNAGEAIALYYRAAATGALPLAGASDLIERLLAAAVDDTGLDAATFRHLTRIIGLDASRARAPVNSELRRRAMARLAAEDWYEEVLAKAERRRGKVARNQRRIARLLLGRIGRYWQPSVDAAALRTWLKQYQMHAPWLSGRIDPRWIARLEGRLRRRQIYGLLFGILFIGGMALQFLLVAIFGVEESDASMWPLLIGPLLVAFFFWILMLLVRELLKLAIPGFLGPPAVRDLALRVRAFRDRLVGRLRED
jgi:hypothetical protein